MQRATHPFEDPSCVRWALRKKSESEREISVWFASPFPESFRGASVKKNMGKNESET